MAKSVIEVLLLKELKSCVLALESWQRNAELITKALRAAKLPDMNNLVVQDKIKRARKAIERAEAGG